MADVSVEFGAKDTGLEQTLKNVQAELAALNEEQKTAAMSADEFQRSLNKLRQLEGLETKLQQMTGATEAVADAAKRAAEPARDLSEEFKKISEPLMTLGQRLSATSAELAELKNRAATAHMSAEELDATLKKIAELEATERRLAKLAKETEATGDAAGGAEPKLDALGDEASELGDKVEGAGQQANSGAGLFDAGFAKIAGAFAVGNIAAKAFEKIVDGVFSAAKAVVDGFGEALDMGARLNALSQQTGEAAGSLLVLEQSFKGANISADQVGGTINKLQNFMAAAGQEGSNQAATMSKLGISLSDLEGKTPTQQMGVFAKAIAAIQDPTQKVAAASEIFGQKLGGKLLPVLNDFPGALDDARSKVGSLESVMNENAKTFDDFGNSIDAVKGKFAAFAAGILGEVIPQIQDLGTSMEQVDAAGLGEKIGSALAPIMRDLNGLIKETQTLLEGLAWAEQQAREDTGALGVAYNGTQSALAGFNNALFDAIKFIAPFDESVEALRETFVGYRKDQDGAIVGVQELGEAAAEAAPEIEEVTERTERFATSLQDIGADSGQAFSDINNGATEFKSLIDEGNISLSDMSGEISAQIPLTNEHVALMGDLNVSLGEANELASEQLNKIEEQISAEQRRNEKIAERQAKSAADYELQVQINKELAAGNTEEAKRLEYQREFSRLTERIMRDTGMTKEDAEQLAANLLSTKNAADAASESARNLANNTRGAKGEAESAKNEFKSVRETMADIENAKMEASPQRLKDRTIDARKELKSMADFIGQDISGMSLDDILKKLGLNPNNFKSTDDKLKALEGAIQKIGSADPADITPDVDLVGVNDRLEKVKEYLKTAGKEKPDVTPEVDQNAVETAVKKAKETIDSELKSPIDVNLDAQKAIGKIREDLKEQIDVAIQSSKGTEHLSSIDKLVGKIEELVSKISDKLPMQALA
jgi:CII-binding regulator of phage lambda lysogenization HflD